MDIYITSVIYSYSDPETAKIQSENVPFVCAFSTFEQAEKEHKDKLPNNNSFSEWKRFCTDMAGVEFWQASYDTYCGKATVYIHKYPLNNFSYSLAGISL